MARLFISHSSKDKEFVRQFSSDLKELGHTVWLDEWEIRVGDCIVTKVAEGLEGADYVVLVLSKHSVASGWVDKEWKTKYWDEIQQRRTIILPVLLEDCEIPILIRTKRYADFRTNSRVGFAQLVAAIEPVVGTGETKLAIANVGMQTDTSAGIPELLAKIQSGTTRLSQCMAEAMALGQRLGNKSLVEFCKDELAGYSNDSAQGQNPPWRFVEAFLSPRGRLNVQYIGFGGNVSRAFEEMQHDKENFVVRKLCILFPLAHLEERKQNDPNTHLLTIELRYGDFFKKAKAPDETFPAYLRADAFARVITSIRVELTKRLLALLPSPG